MLATHLHQRDMYLLMDLPLAHATGWVQTISLNIMSCSLLLIHLISDHSRDASSLSSLWLHSLFSFLQHSCFTGQLVINIQTILLACSLFQSFLSFKLMHSILLYLHSFLFSLMYNPTSLCFQPACNSLFITMSFISIIVLRVLPDLMSIKKELRANHGCNLTSTQNPSIILITPHHCYTAPIHILCCYSLLPVTSHPSWYIIILFFPNLKNMECNSF